MPTINRRALSTSGFDEDVLASGSPGSVILNFGEIGATGVWADGIFAHADRVQISNLGRIDVSGEDASAIWVLGDGARIANFGSAVTRGGSPIDPGSPSAIAIVGDDARIDNFGTASTFGEEGSGFYASGDGFQIANYGLISIEGPFAAGIKASGVNGSIRNLGEIQINHADAISVFGFENTIINGGEINVVRSDGTMGSNGGIVLGGTDNTIINRGNISSAESFFQGITIIGDNNSILNSGNVDSAGAANCMGVWLLGDGNVVRNEGNIVVDSEVYFDFGILVWGFDSRIENFGVIQAKEAIFGSLIAGPTTVVNHGTIMGTVELGFSEDVYVAGSSGTLNGVLTLNFGNDQVVIERNSGALAISDFSAGADTDDFLDLSAFAFKDLSDVLAVASQVDDDVSLQLDNHTSVVLQNVLLINLAANDFVF